MVRLIAIFCLVYLTSTASAWDLAVAVDQKLQLMDITPNGSLSALGAEVEEPFTVTALALDPNRNTLYVSSQQQPNAIYSVSLGPDHQSKFLVEEPTTAEKGMIRGIAFDHVNNVLYWSNGIGGEILFFEMSKHGAVRNVLHSFDNRSTSGLALDECNRVLYWTAYNLSESLGYIEASSLDGSNRRTVLSDMHMPTDITVDHHSQKLYWCDDMEGIYFRIERSNLDGSFREVVIKGIHQKPNSIALTSRYVYWTDVGFHTLWKAEKGKNKNIIRVHTFNSSKARGIISKENSLIFDCSAITKMSTVESILTDQNQEKEETEPQMTEISPRQLIPNKCLNGGTLDSGSRSSETKCRCLPDFRGPLCEIPVCYNYCVNGKCYLDSQGYAQCRCYQGYHGARCENDVCENFCLNGGRCSIGSQGEPVCTCGGDYQGRHCEFKCSHVCQQNHDFVSLDSGTPTCLCNENYQIISADNGTYSSQIAEKRNSNLEMPLTISLIAIGLLCAVFIISTIVLLKTVLRLRKRPRIKKRIIVNKSITPTPLTSRPPPPADQCEITIENCCNMNICETPCYEPQLRSSSKTMSKTEEKKNLLKNMEDGESCSPCQDNLY